MRNLLPPVPLVLQMYFGREFNPSCSLDILAVLPDNSYLLLENSYCLLENSYCLMEKPGLIVKKGFKDLSSLATTLSKLYLVGENHSQAYDDYGLKGSEEEIIFYKEHVETPTRSTMETPSLVLALDSPVLSDPSPSSTLELPSDQGELTGSISGHGLPVRVSAGPYVTPVLPTLLGHTTWYGSNGLYPMPYTS